MSQSHHEKRRFGQGKRKEQKYLNTQCIELITKNTKNTGGKTNEQKYLDEQSIENNSNENIINVSGNTPINKIGKQRV